ncbi:hypothetical protein ES707_04713 [subsurface metagenome]
MEELKERILELKESLNAVIVAPRRGCFIACDRIILKRPFTCSPQGWSVLI